MQTHTGLLVQYPFKSIHPVFILLENEPGLEVAAECCHQQEGAEGPQDVNHDGHAGMGHPVGHQGNNTLR